MRPPVMHAWDRNETTRTPAVLLVLTTVPGQRPPAADGTVPVFRWALTVTARRAGTTAAHPAREHAGTSRDQLATLVDDCVRPGTATWLYAHDLAVHLTTSGLLDRLDRAGWQPLRTALDGPAPSVELGHGPSTRNGHSRSKAAIAYHEALKIPLKDCHHHPDLTCPHRTTTTTWARHLIIADAAAIWPRTTISDLAASLSQPRAPQPAGPGDPAWAEVTRTEASIITQALTTSLTWWDTHQAGNWGKTGATTGWNAMRHRMSSEATFVDITHPATATERTACYGGRRSLFHFGTAPAGTYQELDFYRAYTIIARDMLLPTGRRASFTSLPLNHITLTEARGSVGLIAQVTISRGDGRFPCRAGDRVLYPDGRFTTTLAGPEIREALRLGVLESVGAGQWYTMGRTMSPWARWCLEQQEDPSTPPVVVRMLKHHGRAVIGKTAAHSYAHDNLGPAHHLGFHTEPAVVGPSRRTGWIIDLGGKRILTYQEGEGAESFPAILAYVESHVRVMLSRVIDALGTRGTVQCDTDGLIISVDVLRTAPLPALPDIASPGMPYRTGQILTALNQLIAPLTIRQKAISRTFHATGPQHYQLETSRKRSGIPGNARPDGHGNLTGTTYPSLMEQASRGQPDTYTPVPWAGVDPPCVAGRWVLGNGRTVAPETALTATGETVILPWHLTAACHAGLTLGDTQDPILTSLTRDPGPGWKGTPWTRDDLTRIRRQHA